MSAIILDGKAISKAIREGLKPRVNALKKRGVEPSLHVIIAGDNPASEIYVRNKVRACEQVGIASRVVRLPETVAQDELLRVVRDVNADSSASGLLVQLPLPKHIDEREILRAVDPGKDVDGFHATNAGALMLGEDAPYACTPKGCVEILKHSGVPLCGAHAVVLGRSNIVGKPMALLLLRENCTVTICHSKTMNLSEIARQADILVAAIGIPRFVTAGMIKPGAAVIDVGINRLEDGKVVGDVDFEAAREVAGYITPVPGGVGPMTITMLLQNTLEAAEHAR